MYTAINGIYENGHLTFSEKPPTLKKKRLLCFFWMNKAQLHRKNRVLN